MAEVKKREMGVAGWLKKAGGKVAADAFLAEHRNFLMTGKLAPIAGPILVQLDSGQIRATPALIQIADAVYKFHSAEELRLLTEKEEKKALRQVSGGSSEGSSGPFYGYTGKVFDAEGNLCQEMTPEGMRNLIKKVDPCDAGVCERWIDRKLFDGESGWYATIERNFENGKVIKSVIDRPDAIARILKQPVGQHMKKGSKKEANLSGGMKVNPSRSTFSRG